MDRTLRLDAATRIGIRRSRVAELACVRAGRLYRGEMDERETARVDAVLDGIERGEFGPRPRCGEYAVSA